MALRPLALIGAISLLFAGCGGTGGGAPEGSAGVATPHLAETEVVGAARAGGGDLQLAWAKALRVATAQDVSEFEAKAGGSSAGRAEDWFYVQACSFGGVTQSFWSNPVAHRVVDAAGGGSCDARAAWPPPAPATGNDCMDSWNEWIAHAPINYRAAAASASEAFAGRMDGKCIVVLSDGEGAGVTLMLGETGWALFDDNATPAGPNARVHADGTIEPR